MSSQSTKVAGMPTASIAASTPRPPVIRITFSAALPSLLLTVAVAPKRLAIFKPVIVEIDHDDLGRRIELGRQQRRETDRSRADDRNGVAGLNFAVEHAAFEPGRQDIAQHDQRILLSSFGNPIEACVGVRDAHIFRLRAVDFIAQNPTACCAVGVHALAAILAFAAGGDAGNQHAITRAKRRHAGANAVHHANTFVTKDATRFAGRNITLEDVQIGPANGRLRDLHDRIRRGGDFGHRTLFERFLSRSLIDESLHDRPHIRFCESGASATRVVMIVLMYGCVGRHHDLAAKRIRSNVLVFAARIATNARAGPR